MLKKLLKYDMKSMGRLLFPLSVAVVLTSIIGTISFRIMGSITMDETADNALWILKSTLMIVFVSTIFALIAYAIFSEIMIMYRYYTHLFTDEGYLTFTLPVKTSSILNAKILNAFIWSVFTVIIVVACIFIYTLFGPAQSGEFVSSGTCHAISQFFQDIGATFGAGEIVKYILEFAFMLIVSLLYGTISIFLALTIGSIIAKKHKILASIGIYYAINMAMGIFMGIVNGAFGLMGVYTNQNSSMLAFINDYYLDFTFLLNGIAFLLFAIAGYYITRHLLKNKLNLA